MGQECDQEHSESAAGILLEGDNLKFRSQPLCICTLNPYHIVVVAHYWLAVMFWALEVVGGWWFRILVGVYVVDLEDSTVQLYRLYTIVNLNGIETIMNCSSRVLLSSKRLGIKRYSRCCVEHSGWLGWWAFHQSRRGQRNDTAILLAAFCNFHQQN